MDLFGIRVVIAATDPRMRKRLKDTLFQNNYNIVAEYGEANSLLKSIHKLQPNLIILEDTIWLDSGFEYAKSLYEISHCPLLILADQFMAEKLALLGEEWIFPSIIKPFTDDDLAEAVEKTLYSFDKLFALRKSVSHMPRVEANKELVHKAKLFLMQEHGYTEEQAYREIQKVSMEKRKPKHIIAEAIIISYLYCYDMEEK